MQHLRLSDGTSVEIKGDWPSPEYPGLYKWGVWGNWGSGYMFVELEPQSALERMQEFVKRCAWEPAHGARRKR
jgi:hypothetical protein